MDRAVLTELVSGNPNSDTLRMAGLDGADLLALLGRFQLTGAWRQDLATGLSYWTPAVFELYGLPQSREPVNVLAAIDRFHAEDRAVFAALYEEVLAKRAAFSFTLRVRHGDSYRLVTSIGEYRLNDAGREEMYGLAWLDLSGTRRVQLVQSGDAGG